MTKMKKNRLKWMWKSLKGAQNKESHNGLAISWAYIPLGSQLAKAVDELQTVQELQWNAQKAILSQTSPMQMQHLCTTGIAQECFAEHC